MGSARGAAARHDFPLPRAQLRYRPRQSAWVRRIRRRRGYAASRRRYASGNCQGRKSCASASCAGGGNAARVTACMRDASDRQTRGAGATGTTGHGRAAARSSHVARTAASARVSTTWRATGTSKCVVRCSSANVSGRESLAASTVCWSVPRHRRRSRKEEHRVGDPSLRWRAREAMGADVDERVGGLQRTHVTAGDTHRHAPPPHLAVRQGVVRDEQRTMKFDRHA